MIPPTIRRSLDRVFALGSPPATKRGGGAGMGTALDHARKQAAKHHDAPGRNAPGEDVHPETAAKP